MLALERSSSLALYLAENRCVSLMRVCTCICMCLTCVCVKRALPTRLVLVLHELSAGMCTHWCPCPFAPAAHLKSRQKPLKRGKRQASSHARSTKGAWLLLSLFCGWHHHTHRSSYDIFSRIAAIFLNNSSSKHENKHENNIVFFVWLHSYTFTNTICALIKLILTLCCEKTRTSLLKRYFFKTEIRLWFARMRSASSCLSAHRSPLCATPQWFW